MIHIFHKKSIYAAALFSLYEASQLWSNLICTYTVLCCSDRGTGLMLNPITCKKFTFLLSYCLFKSLPGTNMLRLCWYCNWFSPIHCSVWSWCIFRKVLDERDRVYGELSEYMQLRNTIEQIQVFSSFIVFCVAYNSLMPFIEMHIHLAQMNQIMDNAEHCRQAFVAKCIKIAPNATICW